MPSFGGRDPDKDGEFAAKHVLTGRPPTTTRGLSTRTTFSFFFARHERAAAGGYSECVHLRERSRPRRLVAYYISGCLEEARCHHAVASNDRCMQTCMHRSWKCVQSNRRIGWLERNRLRILHENELAQGHDLSPRTPIAKQHSQKHCWQSRQ
jgi:hypothetical protein